MVSEEILAKCKLLKKTSHMSNLNSFGAVSEELITM